MKEKQVKEYYNNFSENYDQFYQPIQFQKFSELNHLLSSIDYGNCIDLGGGTGLFSLYTNYPVLTLDISPKMIRKGLNNEWIEEGIIADMQQLPLRSASIENLVSFTAIQNTSDHTKSFSEIYRIMTKECKFIITFLRKTFSITEIPESFMQENYHTLVLKTEDHGLTNIIG
ncbi:MAG: class I SAM-dependent methyltransferase [Candidatus Heimdallarchaeota archaeon]|nr:class I SAM-dependent methyltransferase [Candidatus Heimdallarchaeota archaeon]